MLELVKAETVACSTCVSFRFFVVFVSLRETERLWENWLVTAKTAFPPLDATCPAHAWWAQQGHVTAERGGTPD